MCHLYKTQGIVYQIVYTGKQWINTLGCELSTITTGKTSISRERVNMTDKMLI